MNTKDLAVYADGVYGSSIGLMRLVPKDKLDWRPENSKQWFTTGQLLAHLTESTGPGMEGFITGKWPGVHGQSMPTTDNVVSVPNVDAAVEKMEAGRRLTMSLLSNLREDDFQRRMVPAPWNPTPIPLWRQLLLMVEHQINHKAMLFAYLKLMGVKVGTPELYGEK